MDLTSEKRLDEFKNLEIAIEKFSEDEPNDAYQAFLMYVSLSGISRDVQQTAQWSGFTAAQCSRWKDEFQWDSRADVVDAQRWVRDEQQRQEVCKADNLEYAENNRKLKKDGQVILSKMIAVASSLLDSALNANQIKETGMVETKDGRMVAMHTTIEMKAKISDIPRLVSTAFQMSQLISGMPTEIIDNRNIIPSNLQTLTWEELQRLEEDNRDIAMKLSGAQKLSDTPQ